MSDNKEILWVSNSGGETSAYMTYMLIKNYSKKYDVRPIFANTGEENEETLEFIRRCDKYMGFGTVWVEAVTNIKHGVGVTHKLVDFDSASRNSEPFEDYIAFEGIPSRAFPTCSERLKTLPINSYKKMFNYHKDKTCIGIRIDEENRRSLYSAKKYNLVYPLLDWFPTDKQDVNTFWESQAFRLELEPHQGNCKTCWKKSEKKRWLIALESPEKYDFNKRMEAKYTEVKAAYPKDDLFGSHYIPRTFFDGHKTAQQVIDEAQAMDINHLKKMVSVIDDRSSGCGESCEPFQIDIEDLNNA